MAKLIALTLVLVSLVAVLQGTPARASAAAFDLKVYYEGECGGSTVPITIWWDTYVYPAQQWMDISLVNDGFRPETTLAIGPIDRYENWFTLDKVHTNRTTYVRINQLVDGRWQPSQTLVFTLCESPAPVPAPVCNIKGTSASPPARRSTTCPAAPSTTQP